MEKEHYFKDNRIFALDIGTRTVIGAIIAIESGKMQVVAQEIIEHDSRTMFDGQVHDVVKVANTVTMVKRSLEKKVGYKLTGAAIAAAGRALVTKQCRAEMEIDNNLEIDHNLVNSLELSGIAKAHKELDTKTSILTDMHYCVGHSVIKYYLNNYPLTSLLGHRGNIIGADILATFLPVSVVNGLYAVLERAELEPVNMTLEPIAAIDVVIPESMRLLNLTLLDIGAGTSDIAITRKGSVVAYGMVPVAGDEITEAISETFLVDFNEAERIKRSLQLGKDIVYKDILGMENTAAVDEVSTVIKPVVDRLASEVAETIISINGNEPPRTVFCVGGGSRLPGLTASLAAKLGIDERKVAVRGRESIGNLISDEEGLEGPEGVTVIGIGKVAMKKLEQSFITVTVDNNKICLFNTKELTVSDALSLLDFKPRELIGYNGRDLKFTLNGKPLTVYGNLGKPAEISIGNRTVNLKSSIKHGDEIRVTKATNGSDARAVVQDFINETEFIKLTVNSEPKVIKPNCLINGKPESLLSEIKNNDKIEIYKTRNVGELFKGYDLSEWSIIVNGLEVSPDFELKNGNDIKLIRKERASGIDASPNAKASTPMVKKNYSKIEIVVNGNPLTIDNDKDKQIIFIDIFNYIDFDITARKRVPSLKLNGCTAKYTDVLNDGDRIEIYWDDNH